MTAPTDTGFAASPLCPHCGSRDLDACHPAGVALRGAQGHSGAIQWVTVVCAACRRQYEVKAVPTMFYSTRPVPGKETK